MKPPSHMLHPVTCFLRAAVGEDVALALELQCKGHSSCYLHDCLAVGEVPTSIRAICMQKSRSAFVDATYGNCMQAHAEVPVSVLWWCCRLHAEAYSRYMADTCT
jgi:hypothetical protein